MAKAKTTKKTVVAEVSTTPSTAATVTTVSPLTPTEELQQVLRVTDAMSEEAILQADGLPGTRLEFDFVHFKKLSDSFVANLKASTQKAYWIAFTEYSDRERRANIALHSIAVDPMTKILDRPRGTGNPLVRDELKIQALMPRFYVTWRIEGGEGDLLGAVEAGFRVMRRPKDAEEEKTKPPTEWSGEVWKIRDGTYDPQSQEAIYNVMVYIEKQRWEDHLKAMSMASHNAYSSVKKSFVEGAENISKDMLGSKEQIVTRDLDELRAEEFTFRNKEGR